MSTGLQICPYCNSQFPSPVGGAPGTRVSCPRCDETFPWRPPLPSAEEAALVAPPQPVGAALGVPFGRLAWLASISALTAVVSLALYAAFPEDNTTRRALPFMLLLAAVGLVASLWLWFLRTPRTNRALAGFVLGNMAGIALVVLPFALGTTGFRRGNDPRKPPEEPPSPVGSSHERNRRAVSVPSVAPAELAALGYLPDDCKIAVGFHVAELWQQPLGADLLARRKGDAAAVQAPWLLELGLGRAEEWTGLDPRAIDHVVFGTRIIGVFNNIPLPDKLTFVVRTHQPYDPAAVKAAQQALAAAQGKKVVPIKHLERELYNFSTTEPPGYGILWLADPQTIVVVWNFQALLERDILALPAKPRSGKEGPAPPALRAALTEHLGKGTLVWWCAADVEQTRLAASLVPGAGNQKELAGMLDKVRTLTGGLRLQGQDAAVLANLECADVSSARALADQLRQQTLRGLDKLKVDGPPEEGGEPWVLLQARGSPEAVVRALRDVRLLTGRGKK
jgi:hypothetical protein